MRLCFEGILWWLLGIAVIYFGLAGLGAFIYADWSILDFTTWTKHSRLFLGLVFLVWSVFWVAV